MENSLKREIAAGKFEVADTGLYLPKSRVTVGGVFTMEHYREGDLIHTQQSPNTIVNVGLDHILNVVFASGTQDTTWFVSLFKSSLSVTATDTMSSLAATEITYSSGDVTEAARQAYTVVTTTTQQVTNTASKATFTSNATMTIYGAFLNTDSSGTAGTLMAESAFAASRAVVATDQLLITYTISAADA